MFTLVEMMIVVAIVMLLAAIAIPLVVEYQVRAKEAEVNLNTDGIRTATVAYIAAIDTAVQQSAAWPRNLYTKSAVAWPSGSGFDALGWRPDGTVRGAYMLGVPPSSGSPWVARGCIDADVDGMCTACEGTESAFQCRTDTSYCGCFVAGTSVLLPDGSERAIEEIVTGDAVLAVDEQGRLGGNVVEATLAYGPRPLILLELEDGTSIVGTRRHPFYTGLPQSNLVDENQWTELGDLRRGDVVYRVDAESELLMPVTVERVVPIPLSLPVYNLTVGVAHTFFAEGILTHNKMTAPCGAISEDLWY